MSESFSIDHTATSRGDTSSTTLPQVGTAEESIPRAFVPWPRDDNRSRYLGLCASGFTVREALNLIGDAKSTLSHWRKDPVFADLEHRVPELRKELALEYASLEFLRNYRLVLEKDFRVLKESLIKRTRTIEIDGKPMTVPEGMSSQDFQYLLRLRAHYTPEQLRNIEQLFGKQGSQNPMSNWTDFFLSISRTKEEVRIGTRQARSTEPQLSKITEGVIVDEQGSPDP